MVFTRFQPLRAPWVCVLVAVASPAPAAAEQDVLRSPETTAATQYAFTPADEALLDEIQLGCFNYLWREVGSPSGLAKDRRTTAVASTAGVGFQLSALPIGVERGWITRAAGAERAVTILRTLVERTDNKHEGLYLHFVMADDGSQPSDDTIDQASTVDHALFQAGVMTAAEYFGGEVESLANQVVDAANWQAYAVSQRGYITFGWRPNDNATMDGPGKYRPWDWHLASDEERLVYFLAVGAPRDEHAVAAGEYYRLQRNVERHADGPPFVVSWNGALFTYFFSHCWIDFGEYEADNPAEFGQPGPRIDWVENSRRATLTHRQRCIEAAAEFATLGPNRWGLSPCMGLNAEGRDSYLVQDVQPNLSDQDAWQGGTVAPYAAGSAIMFTPIESMAALHEFRRLQDRQGKPLAWRDPGKGGYALVDSFNLDQQHASDDNIAIDVGPMLLAIENVRTGLVWKLFMQHPVAQRAVERLRWQRRTDSPRDAPSTEVQP